LVTRTSATEESWSIITGVLKEHVVVVTLAATEESCVTDVLREDVVVVGNSLALVTVTDDLYVAVEMKHKYKQVDHNTSSIPATTTLVLMQ